MFSSRRSFLFFLYAGMTAWTFGKKAGRASLFVDFVFEASDGQRVSYPEDQDWRDDEKGDAVDREFIHAGKIKNISQKRSDKKIIFTYEFSELNAYLEWESRIVMNKIFRREKIPSTYRFRDSFYFA